jgi:hypothetical protein
MSIQFTESWRRNACLFLSLFILMWSERIAAQTREVIDGARKEGQLVFYSGIPIPDAQAILTALEKNIRSSSRLSIERPAPPLCREFKPNSVPARISGM